MMPPKRIAELALMALACHLLAVIAWQRWPGDPWAFIGLVLTPVLLLLLLVAVIAERR